MNKNGDGHREGGGRAIDRRVWNQQFAVVLGKFRSLRYAVQHLKKRYHPGETQYAELPSRRIQLPLANTYLCVSCGEPGGMNEASSYGNLCENCFASNEARRQSRDEDRRQSTDNSPRHPIGCYLKQKGRRPGTIPDEEVDYFGGHAGR